MQSYKKPKNGRYPTPVEYRAQAYIALLHGAKGLMWYGGSVQGGAYLNVEESNWDYLKKLAGEMKEMAPVFMSPTQAAPKFSPDGERIAFMSWRNGRTEIFTMNADGSNQQPIVTMPTGGAIDPRWSPDGTRIAFVHVAESTAQDAQNPNDHRIIYVVDVASGKTTRLSR